MFGEPLGNHLDVTRHDRVGGRDGLHSFIEFLFQVGSHLARFGVVEKDRHPELLHSLRNRFFGFITQLPPLPLELEDDEKE